MGETCVRNETCVKKFGNETQSKKKKDHSEDLDLDRRITLRWIFWKQSGRMWTGFLWLRTGTGGGLL
jgi:hypothetical protein